MKTEKTGELLQAALTHHQAGRIGQAEQIYRSILAVEPDNADANHLLGLLAYQVGKYDIAVTLIQKAIQQDPGQSIFYNNLGNALKADGKLPEAVASFKQALAIRSDYAEAHYNLGNALMGMGQPGEAIDFYQKAATLVPDFAEAYYNLGNAYRNTGNQEEAVAAYKLAVTSRDDFVEAHYNLGNVFLDLGRLAKAEECFRKALDLKVDYVEAHNNLGRVLRERGKLDEAIACYRKALSLDSGYVESLNNLGNALRDKGDLSGAIATYRRAVNFDQGRAETCSNLGYSLHEAGLFSEAVRTLQRAIVLKPDYDQANSNLFFALNYDSHSTQDEIHKKSEQWGDSLLQKIRVKGRVYVQGFNSDRQLRIGYLSPDFRDHSVAYFIEPVLKAHDREVVEVFCYANVKQPDDTTARIAAEADHWHTIVRQTDAEVAEQVKRDNIDILVDLAGHTGDNRLPVFARKPAPVQVSWIGYPNTTGLRTIDYRFTDAVADPQGETDRFYTEKLVRLEHGFLCYQPEAAAPEVGALPCLEKEHVTFGSFNNLAKVRPEVVEVWARILHAVPSSRLLLKAKQLRDEEIRKRYLEMFTAEGIAPDRIEMLGMLPRKRDHLGLYNRVDIGLDPFPYSGTTTTCEALWMGVPVVTLAGNRHAGRVGASLLHRIGLDGLVAGSMAEYVSLARSLAEDTELLQELRCNLRERLRNSNLMDSRRFTRHLEDVYRDMWRKYCHNSTRE